MTDEFGQLTEKELAVGYWWVTHRLKIKAALIILSIVFIVGIYANAGWELYKYLMQTPLHQAMLTELTNNLSDYDQIKSSSAPSPLLLGNTLAIGNKNDGYDLITEVENVNPRWWLKEIEYYYVIDGKTTNTMITNVLPADKKYLVIFNYPGTASASNAKLFIKRQLWTRVKDQSQLDSRNRWLKPKITVGDILTNVSSGLLDTRTNFTIINDSPYSFWELELQIILWQGNRIVGVNALTINDLSAGENRVVEVLWPTSYSGDIKTEVLVYPNSLNSQNIRLFPDNSPSLIR